MNKIFLVASIFISTISYSQTKKETIDWLNEKFGGNQTLIYSSEVISYVRHLKINSDGSFIITHTEFWNNRNGTKNKWITTFTGHFKDLSPNSFRIDKNEVKGAVSFASTSNTFLYLNCTSGDKIKQISYKEGTTPEQGKISSIFYHNSVTIGIVPEGSDQSLIQRSKKAFIHLIKLCGGKNEKF